METVNTVFTPAMTPVRIGIDVGSTTVKVVCLDENDKMIYGDYQRHRADIRNTIITVVTKALNEIEGKLKYGEKHTVSAKVTGSGGLSVSFHSGSCCRHNCCTQTYSSNRCCNRTWRRRR